MKRLLLNITFVLCFILSGCSMNKSAVVVDDYCDSLAVEKSGTITQILCEDFDKDYYSLDSLNEMIKEDIEGYDIKLIQSIYDDSRKVVSVKLEYADYNAFNDYNEDDLFLGTVLEAYEKGLLKNRLLVNQKTSEFEGITEENIEKLGKYYIFIFNENVDLYVPSKVLYLDDSATLIENTKVGFTDSTQNHIIIFK